MRSKESFIRSIWSLVWMTSLTSAAFGLIQPPLSQNYRTIRTRRNSAFRVTSSLVRAQPNNVGTPTLQQPSKQPLDRKHKHTLAILTMPHSASARIANEAILEKAISVTTEKLSVVLRTNTGGTNSQTGEGHSNVSLTNLRRYAGEIYSMAWDAALGLDERENSEPIDGATRAGPITNGGKLLDLIVYPHNMPNTPPEGWIANRPDLTCICSHDSITGWVSADDYAGGSGRKYASRKGQGMGGLVAHVKAVNAEREMKGLNPLVALHVDDWPDGADITGDPNVIFLEDEDAYKKVARRKTVVEDASNAMVSEDANGSNTGISSLIGGTPIPPSSLYSSVAVGGTFDGMHYGHRKLLTLAISSVQPINGRLLIGVTRDEMLTHKAFADRIPPLDQRIAGVLDFIGNLAPGMKNRIRCIPINDEYGPPGQPSNSEVYPGLKNDFDALVLSHETLPTGRKLNNYRESVLGLKPLKLLCTQRTEPHGMSSTALRRMRKNNL
ncbi:hypothetical protein HJC23_003322 [Cyclotella cryptica]|uniref:Cytidyltransferase-like domain-containing protein n=1 Tax=Cyclotella cryptica TaxID=29204 RepID=A0ABD3QYK2_9STRA|eukprot:CCRYP_000884-RA/>CCRYP_000884-RA protein AED:0.05 eAED:-0.05 QI:0/-1/0/1/-1/1/1/0/496